MVLHKAKLDSPVCSLLLSPPPTPSHGHTFRAMAPSKHSDRLVTRAQADGYSHSGTTAKGWSRHPYAVPYDDYLQTSYLCSTNLLKIGVKKNPLLYIILY